MKENRSFQKKIPEFCLFSILTKALNRPNYRGLTPRVRNYFWLWHLSTMLISMFSARFPRWYTLFIHLLFMCVSISIFTCFLYGKVSKVNGRTTYTMVPILDGNSEICAHVRSNLCYLICLRHFFLYREQSQIGFICVEKTYFLSCMRNMFWVTMVTVEDHLLKRIPAVVDHSHHIQTGA